MGREETPDPLCSARDHRRSSGVYDLGCLFRVLRYDAATSGSTLTATGTNISMYDTSSVRQCS